jgi:hypothetical protein
LELSAAKDFLRLSIAKTSPKPVLNTTTIRRHKNTDDMSIKPSSSKDFQGYEERIVTTISHISQAEAGGKNADALASLCL